MKIKELKISNILSFAHKEDIEDATPIIFNDDLNILIGENGSGKSTTLEVINFIFKKVIFKQSDFREDIYENKESRQNEIKDILNFSSNNNFNEFKLNKNWNYPNKERKIKIKIELEEIDQHNIKIIEDNYDKLKEISEEYSRNSLNNQSFSNELNIIIVDISIIVKDDNSIVIKESQSTKEFLYLEKFNLFKNLIRIYNLENENKIEELKDTFVMLGAYRNYENFNLDVNTASSISYQKQKIEQQNFNKGMSTVEKEEPSIFKFVMFTIAEKHKKIRMENHLNQESSFEKINDRDNLVKKINEKLSLINLKIKLDYANRNSTDQYTFKFITNNREVDIKNLSAGQKAILHLVFESYGRNDLKGGVVIIDEPEIHLHYQFQHEYIKILNEIKKEQQCQYVLVTHSEALINSKSIEFVKRFYLDENKNSTVVSPEIKGDDKNSIKILDNYRSTHAFFCNKVLLVEGETDKYFFQEYIKSKYPVKINQIAVLDVMGKGQYEKWKDFFEKFKIEVYFIGDFDNAVGFKILTKKQLDTAKKEIKKSFIKKMGKEIDAGESSKDGQKFIQLVWEYFEEDSEGVNKKEEIKNLLKYLKSRHVSYKEIVENLRKNKDWDSIKNKIEEKYKEGIFILQKGDLESYLNKKKGLDEVINFCNENLKSYEDEEIKNIFQNIFDENK